MNVFANGNSSIDQCSVRQASDLTLSSSTNSGISLNNTLRELREVMVVARHVVADQTMGQSIFQSDGWYILFLPLRAEYRRIFPSNPPTNSADHDTCGVAPNNRIEGRTEIGSQGDDDAACS